MRRNGFNALLVLALVINCKPIKALDYLGDNEYVFNAYYDDLINPGFKFSFDNTLFKMEVPEMDDATIEEGKYIKNIISGHYRVVSENGFRYILVDSKKYLLLSYTDLICVLIDNDNNDAFFGLNSKSKYVRIGKSLRETFIGIKGGMGDYQKESSVLSERIGGETITFDGLDNYYYQITKPWVENKPGDGLGEWIQKRIAYETNEVVIFNGYINPRRPDLYTKNSRIREMDIVVDENVFTYSLADTPNPQLITLPRKISGDIRFVIKSVYRGEKFSDTALAGIYFLDSLN